MAVSSETSLKPPIAVTPEEWQLIAASLKEHLPNRNIWAFGSRATGKNLKRFSDLDLLIDGPPLSLLESALVKEAFDQSMLPFKVDVVERDAITPEFQTHIEHGKVLLLSSHRG